MKYTRASLLSAELSSQMSGNPGPGKPQGGLPQGPGMPQVSSAPQNRVAPLAAAPMAAMAGLGAGPEGRNPSQHSELAALFECPVCFDYVLPPILQVRHSYPDSVLLIFSSTCLLTS